MVRILNFVCVALMGFAILALYHVSEKTRVAHMELAKVNAATSPQEHGAIGVLETEWQHVASAGTYPAAGRRRGWAWRTAPRCSFPPSISCRAVAQIPRR